MRLNQKLCLFLSILLASCHFIPYDEYEYAFTTILVINEYYNDLYLGHRDWNTPTGDIVINYGLKKSISLCLGKCAEYGYSEQIDFYQDAERTCFLFSIDNSTIISNFRKKQRNTGREYISDNNLSPTEAYNAYYKEYHEREKLEKGVMMIIEKDKIYAVSKEEYDRIKTTLKPHPYDSSLCKPKPAVISKGANNADISNMKQNI